MHLTPKRLTLTQMHARISNTCYHARAYHLQPDGWEFFANLLVERVTDRVVAVDIPGNQLLSMEEEVRWTYDGRLITSTLTL